jgi:hypothetical protein
MSDVKVQDEGREVMERLIARGLVILGGAFWTILAVGTELIGPYKGLPEAAMKYAAVPMAIAAIVLGIGWRYERLASVLLFVAAVGVIIYGAIVPWEMGVWGFMGLTLIAPMLLSGVMFLLAAIAESKRERA